jgi:hypothetical protein
MFTKAHQRTQSWASWIQSTPLLTVPLRFILTSSSYVLIISHVFLSDFPIEILHTFLISQWVLHVQSIFSFLIILIIIAEPVTVAARSTAWTVFARSEAGFVGSNPTQGMNVWYVYVFILCLCCPVIRYRPCDELITHPRSPTVCAKMITALNARPGPWMGRKNHWKK